MNILLQNLLLPLNQYLTDPCISDISINQPGEVWIDDGTKIQCLLNSDLNFNRCLAITQQIATFSEQTINEQHPLLSAHLPNGERIQIILNPATLWIDDQNKVATTIALSIRKLQTTHHKLETYVAQGGFSLVGQSATNAQQHLETIKELKSKKKYMELLRYAILNKQTVLVSGATYSGKTSFLNMLVQEIPLRERIITIEDVPELQVPHPNRVRLFYSRGSQGRALIQASDLVLATLRMRPDRIILGELRGDDAIHWLTAANSGHPGTLATIHADEPMMALEKLILMVMASQPGLSREAIYRYVTRIVKIIVQLKRNPAGLRYVADILLINE